MVACQRGLVYVLPEDRQSAELAVFLDFRDRLKEEIHFEAGLHALVFHPDFARNGRFYLTYSQSDRSRQATLAPAGVGAPQVAARACRIERWAAFSAGADSKIAPAMADQAAGSIVATGEIKQSIQT